MSTTLYAVTVEFVTPPLKREESFLIPATREGLQELRKLGLAIGFTIKSYGFTHVRSPQEVAGWVAREQLETKRALGEV